MTTVIEKDAERPEASDGTATASEKTLLVLEAAFAHARFSDVVQAAGPSQTATHRILTTLPDRGFVALTPDGSYLPGSRLLARAGAALARIDISGIAQPYVDRLVAQVRCTVHVSVANGDEVMYLIRTDPDKPYQMPSRVGLTIPMHSSAIGKTILASYTDGQVRALVTRTGLQARTHRTITTLARLGRALEDVRHQGYALDIEENLPGIHCVAAPIRDHAGRVRYGISVSALSLEHTADEIEAMAVHAVRAAEDISVALGWRAAG